MTRAVRALLAFAVSSGVLAPSVVANVPGATTFEEDVGSARKSG